MAKNRYQLFFAFSLPELLVVLVIIGILVLVALPNLMPLISRAKATEAQQQLTFLHSLEQSYFYTYSRYSGFGQEDGNLALRPQGFCVRESSLEAGRDQHRDKSSKIKKYYYETDYCYLHRNPVVSVNVGATKR